MDLEVTIGGKAYLIPDSITNLVFIAIAVVILTLLFEKKLKKVDPREKPSGIVNIFEIGVESIDKLVISTMGEQNLKFAPYILTLAVLIGLSNLLGLIGLTSPTSNYSVTFALALVTFTLTQIFKWRSNGGFGGYLKSFTEPMALLTPINLIGEIANPISLSFRLFGNVMSGGLIMMLVYGFLGYAAPLLTPWMHAYFDVFSGVLQTFIFCMLTMIYVGGDAE